MYSTYHAVRSVIYGAGNRGAVAPPGVSYGTPWDITTAGTYLLNDKSYVDPNTVEGMAWGDSGYKLYMVNLNGSVYQYNVATPYDITTMNATAAGSFDVSTQEASPQAVEFKPDGTKMYIAGNDQAVSQYTLSSPWNVTSATHDGDGTLDYNGWSTGGMHFKSDGTEIYFTFHNIGTTAYLYKQPLGTPWDATTLQAGDGGDYILITAQTGLSTGIHLSDDGTLLQVSSDDAGADAIFQYTLGTAFDLTTATLDVTYDTSGLDTAIQDVTFNNDGTIMYFPGNENDRIYQIQIVGAADMQTRSTDTAAGSVLAVTTDGTGNYILAGGAGISYSSDKVTWTAASGGATDIGAVGTNKTGIWIAAGTDGKMWKSTDNGQNWTLKDTVTMTSPREVVYDIGTDRFLVICGATNDSFYTADGGETWNTITSAVLTHGAWQIAITDGTTITVHGDNGASRYTTNGGDTWSAAGAPVVTTRGGYYANGSFVFSNNNGRINESATGQGAWSNVDIDTSIATAHNFIFYDPILSKWITSNTSHVWYESSDLITFTKITGDDYYARVQGQSGNSAAVDDDGEGYVIVLTDGSIMYKNATAPVVSTQQVIASTVGIVTGVASDGAGNWVVAGASGVAYSSNKTAWTNSLSIIGGTPLAVTTDGAGNWVMATNSSNIYRSIDNGVTWNLITAGTNISEVEYHASADKFYAFSITNGSSLVSTDGGASFGAMAGLTGTGFQTSVTNGTRVVIAGTSGTTKYTDDGITWSTADSPGVFQSFYSGDFGNGGFALGNAAGAVYYNATGFGTWTVIDPDGANSAPTKLLTWLPSESRWVFQQGTQWYESTDLTTWGEILSGDFFGLNAASEDAGKADGTGYVIPDTAGNLIIKNA